VILTKRQTDYNQVLIVKWLESTVREEIQRRQLRLRIDKVYNQSDFHYQHVDVIALTPHTIPHKVIIITCVYTHTCIQMYITIILLLTVTILTSANKETYIHVHVCAHN